MTRVEKGYIFMASILLGGIVAVPLFIILLKCMWLVVKFCWNIV